MKNVAGAGKYEEHEKVKKDENKIRTKNKRKIQ